MSGEVEQSIRHIEIMLSEAEQAGEERCGHEGWLLVRDIRERMKGRMYCGATLTVAMDYNDLLDLMVALKGQRSAHV